MTPPPKHHHHHHPRPKPAVEVDARHNPSSEHPLRDADEGESDTSLRSAQTLTARMAELVRENAELKAKAADNAGPELAIRARAGGSQWWVAVLTVVLGAGAGAGASAGVRAAQGASEPTRPQVDDLRGDVKALQSDRDKAREALTARDKAEAQRLRILAAFACKGGLRARHLDCDDLQRDVDFEQQPLEPKKPPVWKTREEWPAHPGDARE